MSHASVIVALSPEDIHNIEEAVEFQMAPFDENGEWFREGSRWDWWVIGGRYSGKLLGKDVMKRSELSETALRNHSVMRAQEMWARFEKETSEHKHWLYGIEEGETLETRIEKAKREILTSYAFLRDRKWIESGRLGWWGGEAHTECELASEDWEERCVHKMDGASIATFTGPKDSKDTWYEMYWARFIRPLPNDTTLVCVDYHV